MTAEDIAPVEGSSSSALPSRSFSNIDVDVLFKRMQSTEQTVAELTSFWTDRAAIEEEYAKKLSDLAKRNLKMGRDETGEMMNAIDTTIAETLTQASAHSQLAQRMRYDLERPTKTFREQLAFELDKQKLRTSVPAEKERERKTFAGNCQKLEVERIELIKDELWAYANAISTVSVTDDESCERIRVALEKVNIDTEIQAFVSSASEPLVYTAGRRALSRLCC